MSIPEEMIMGHLNHLLGSSDPGDSIHHLYVVSAPAGAVGPLGLVPEDRLALYVYAIAPDSSVDVEQFVAKVVVSAAVSAVKEGRVALFAAMSQEVWAVEPMDAEGHRLLAEGRLGEHPRVADLTVVYGVCQDGRRWRGRRWLTGEKAGQMEDVDLLVGPPRRGESRGVSVDGLMRRLVGMPG